MNILIAGGAGYVGSRLVPELQKNGHDITVLDVLWFGNHFDESVPVIKKDIFETGAETLKGFDVVIFLAGLSNDPMAEYSPALNFISNAAAPAYLAFVAKSAGVKRFIHASSGSVYGFTENKLSDENSPAKSGYPYGISKLQGENGVMQALSSDFSVIILRKGTISGYSPRMRLDLIVNTMYAKAMLEGKITVNNPAIWRPILSINDAVAAYVKAVEAPREINGIFNILSENCTVGEVGEKIRQFFKEKIGKNIEVETKNIEDKRNYKLSNAKAMSVLGCDFHGSVESILEELRSRLGENFDFLSDDHYNIKIFKKIFADDGLISLRTKI